MKHTSAPLILLALALVLSSASAGGACDAQLKKCGVAAGKFGVGVVKPVHACKAFRVCKRSCRREKRSDLRHCRRTKRSCRRHCRRTHRRRRDRRRCRRSCRRTKRRCKRAARKEKRVCRRVCRSTYKTPACKKARRKIFGSVLKTIGSCLAVAKCIARNQ